MSKRNAHHGQSQLCAGATNPQFMSIHESLKACDLSEGFVVGMQVAFVLFTAATAVWGSVVFRARQNAHRIHYLMIALVACKALTLLSQAGMYHLIRITGQCMAWHQRLVMRGLHLNLDSCEKFGMTLRKYSIALGSSYGAKRLGCCPGGLSL